MNNFEAILNQKASKNLDAIKENFVVPYIDTLPEGAYVGYVKTVKATSEIFNGCETVVVEFDEILTDGNGRDYYIKFKYFEQYNGVDNLLAALADGGYSGILRNYQGAMEKVKIQHGKKYAFIKERCFQEYRQNESVEAPSCEDSTDESDIDAASKKKKHSLLGSRRHSTTVSQEERRRTLISENDEDDEFNNFYDETL